MAYCRHNGTHSTVTRPHGCWNSALVKKANELLGTKWEELDGDLESSFDQWSASLGDAIQSLRTLATGLSLPSLCLSQDTGLASKTDSKSKFLGFGAPLSFVTNLSSYGTEIYWEIDGAALAYMGSFR
jgi:hypothetical protein